MMYRRDKIVAWGRDRLVRHEQDMERFLAYLYDERQQTAEGEIDQDLEERFE